MLVPLVNALIAATQVARPAPLWHGVDTIALHCDDDRAGLCERLAERARRGAPMRITTAAETAMPSMLRMTATFGAPGGPLSLTLAADRPVPMDDAQGSLLPRRFVAAAGESPNQFLDRALDAFLPWRGRHGPGRMISLPKGKILK